MDAYCRKRYATTDACARSKDQVRQHASTGHGISENDVRELSGRDLASHVEWIGEQTVQALRVLGFSGHELHGGRATPSNAFSTSQRRNCREQFYRRTGVKVCHRGSRWARLLRLFVARCVPAA